MLTRHLIYGCWLSLLVLAGCQKEPLQPLPISPDTAARDADLVFFQSGLAGAFNAVVAQALTTPALSGIPLSNVAPACPVSSVLSTNAVGNVLTVDFGDGCEEVNGLCLSGSFSITVPFGKTLMTTDAVDYARLRFTRLSVGTCEIVQCAPGNPDPVINFYNSGAIQPPFSPNPPRFEFYITDYRSYKLSRLDAVPCDNPSTVSLGCTEFFPNANAGITPLTPLGTIPMLLVEPKFNITMPPVLDYDRLHSLQYDVFFGETPAANDYWRAIDCFATCSASNFPILANYKFSNATDTNADPVPLRYDPTCGYIRNGKLYKRNNLTSQVYQLLDFSHDNPTVGGSDSATLPISGSCDPYVERNACTGLGLAGCNDPIDVITMN